VGGVGDESALAVEGVVEALEHDVEGVGQLLELVVWAVEGEAFVQAAVGGWGVGDPPGGLGHLVQWLERRHRRLTVRDGSISA